MQPQQLRHSSLPASQFCARPATFRANTGTCPVDANLSTRPELAAQFLAGTLPPNIAHRYAVRKEKKTLSSEARLFFAWFWLNDGQVLALQQCAVLCAKAGLSSEQSESFFGTSDDGRMLRFCTHVSTTSSPITGCSPATVVAWCTRPTRWWATFSSRSTPPWHHRCACSTCTRADRMMFNSKATAFPAASSPLPS